MSQKFSSSTAQTLVQGARAQGRPRPAKVRTGSPNCGPPPRWHLFGPPWFPSPNLAATGRSWRSGWIGWKRCPSWESALRVEVCDPDGKGKPMASHGTQPRAPALRPDPCGNCMRMEAGLGLTRMAYGVGVVFSGSCEKRRPLDPFLQSRWLTMGLCFYSLCLRLLMRNKAAHVISWRGSAQ
jgi:hypothetical protein